MKPATIVRVFGCVAGIEIVYLIVANVLLNLPLTQTWLNDHKPDRYAVYWDHAYSWFPMRIRADGVSANGQTANQQWQVDTSRMSFSLSPLALLQRTVLFRAVDARNVEVSIRPRLKPDSIDTSRRQYFPRIRDRDPEQAAEPAVVRPGSGWKIMIDNLQVHGDHQMWIHQVRAVLQGNLSTNVNITTLGGPLELSKGMADVAIHSLAVNGKSTVQEAGTISAQFDLAPFVASQNRGRTALDFLSVDARMELAVDSLGFLDIYLHRFNAMEIDGRGTMRGRLQYVRGKMLEGTQMAVLAPELVLKASPYSLEGTGRIDISADGSDSDRVSVDIAFDTLTAFHGAERRTLFSGEKMEISAIGGNQIPAGVMRSSDVRDVHLRLPQVRVPDLSAFQYLLPETWQLRLMGGSGTLQGMLAVSAASTHFDLQLQSDEADLEFKEYRFTTNLDVGIEAVADASTPASFNITGTHLKLDNARLRNRSKVVSSPWNADFSIAQGTISLPLDKRVVDEADVDYLLRTLKKPEPRDILRKMNADVVAQLNVSELSWLNLLFRNPFELVLKGAGAVEANIGIREGWLEQGTTLSVMPQGLKIQMLDYDAQGQGKIVVTVERGGESPDLALDASLTQGSLKRRGTGGAVIEDVHLEVAATAHDVTLDDKATVEAIDIRIPSARVQDISAYNQYLPEQLPLRLIAGEAHLSSDIKLTPASARGSVILESGSFQSRLGEQQLSGAVTMDIKISNGVPADRQFDISGSSLHLNNVKVTGDHAQFDQSDWSAQIDFEKARGNWKDPVQIDVQAAVSLLDSRPFTALLANQRGRHGWIEKLLTVEDIRGKADFHLSSNELRIPYALVGSDTMDVGFKALINEDTREGMVFVRYGKISGILKSRDGKRDFDVLGARKTFDDYYPGDTDVFLKKRTPLSRSVEPRR